MPIHPKREGYCWMRDNSTAGFFKTGSLRVNVDGITQRKDKAFSSIMFIPV
jgi:hypothetical protein